MLGTWPSVSLQLLHPRVSCTDAVGQPHSLPHVPTRECTLTHFDNPAGFGGVIAHTGQHFCRCWRTVDSRDCRSRACTFVHQLEFVYPIV